MTLFDLVFAAVFLAISVAFLVWQRILERAEMLRPLEKATPYRPVPEIVRKLYLHRLMYVRQEWFAAPEDVRDWDLFRCWGAGAIERKIGRCVKITPKGKRIALGLNVSGATGTAPSPTAKSAADAKAKDRTV